MYFSNAKVGNRVWDYVYGGGKIKRCYRNTIHVKYCYKDSCVVYRFTGKIRKADGKTNQRLFYYDNRPMVIIQDDIEGLEKDVLEYKIVPMPIYVENKIGGQYFIKDWDSDKYTRKVHRGETCSRTIIETHNIEDLFKCPKCGNVTNIEPLYIAEDKMLKACVKCSSIKYFTQNGKLVTLAEN